MSQAKVDRYKEEKKNRQQIMKKEKREWMLTKLAGVVFLFGWHGFLSKARRAFAEGRNTRSEKFWRATNELPFIVAIIMVLAVTTEFGRR